MNDRSHRLFLHILWGIAAGIVLGILVGDEIRPLAFVATGFIRLLQVNVLPYLLGSLIASLGSRGTSEMKTIARYGAGFLVFIWALTLLLVVVSPLALPPAAGAPVFGLDKPTAQIDWLDLYIPANLFHALSNNLIPAVVLFGILAGVALGQMPAERKAVLVQSLEAFNEAMSRVSRMILRLTPFGLFAIAAVTAGELRTTDLLRLQAWLGFYAGGALLLTLWILPSLVARFTQVSHRRFLGAMRNAIVTATAAGDVLVVLPLIAEATKELLVERGAPPADTDKTVSVVVPLLYNFPHAGKILSLAFLPFAAWFSGSALSAPDLGLLATAGPLSMFGSINAAVPFLLDLLRLPADLFELFSVSSVVNSRFGSMAAATHTAAISVVVAAALVGALRVSVRRLARFAIVTAVILLAFVSTTRTVFTLVLPQEPAGLETLAPFTVRAPLVTAAVVAGSTSTRPPEPGQRLREIQARGVLRVGYFPDAVPWAFMNAAGELVGYDIEAAHRLAGQLGVTLEFVLVPRTPPRPSEELAAGHIDLLMTGFVATVSRAERMELSQPYATEHPGFLVRDFDRGRFETLDALDGGTGMTVAIPPVQGATELVKQIMPEAETVTYDTLDHHIGDPRITALLMSLERAYYWSRVYPNYTAIKPQEMTGGAIAVYAMPLGELELRNVVDLWIETRRASGEAEEAYDYWIRGKALRPRTPRWSVIRDVFGWR